MQSTRFQAFKRIELNYAVIKADLFVKACNFERKGVAHPPTARFTRYHNDKHFVQLKSQ